MGEGLAQTSVLLERGGVLPALTQGVGQAQRTLRALHPRRRLLDQLPEGDGRLRVVLPQVPVHEGRVDARRALEWQVRLYARL